MSALGCNAFRLAAVAVACLVVGPIIGAVCDPPPPPAPLADPFEVFEDPFGEEDEKESIVMKPGGKVVDIAIWWVLALGGYDETGAWEEEIVEVSPNSVRNDGLASGAKAAATSTGGGAPNNQTVFLPNAALFAGGIGKRPDFPDASPQAYFYDFTADEWTGLEMGSPRRLHTLTTLLDGRILIVGGWDGKFVPGLGAPPVTSTELFDPSDLTFRPGGALLAARSGHAAARLADGRVLVVGGGTGITSNDPLVRLVQSVEIYDPATDSFTATGGMLVTLNLPMATTLDDGRVLVCGDESLTNAEAFDPLTGTFSAVGNMTAIHNFGATATKLKDGRVLILGGGGADGGNPTAIAELFDPAANTFTAIAPMRIQRANHLAILQDDGTVLVAGGSQFEDGNFTETAWSDSFDPATNTFAPLPDMPSYSSHGAGVFLKRE